MTRAVPGEGIRGSKLKLQAEAMIFAQLCPKNALLGIAAASPRVLMRRPTLLLFALEHVLLAIVSC